MERLLSQANIGRRASNRLGITEGDKPSRKRPYKKKNGLNCLSFHVLRVLSEFPDEPFTKKIIYRKAGGPEWSELIDCLNALVGHDCVEYIPKEKSTVGHDTYRIIRLGRDILSDFYSNDPIPKIRRDLLGVK